MIGQAPRGAAFAQGTAFDLQRLLAEARRAGVPTLDLWEMTPRETTAAIEVATWREEQDQRRMLSLAWHVAALTRARRLPSLAQLLRPPSKVKDVPIEERRREFAEMQAIVSKTWRRKLH